MLSYSREYMSCSTVAKTWSQKADSSATDMQKEVLASPKFQVSEFMEQRVQFGQFVEQSYKRIKVSEHYQTAA